MQRLNGVATKYLDNYLSWFHFLDVVKHRRDNETVSKMIVESSLFPSSLTYNSIRMSLFIEKNKNLLLNLRF